MGNNECLDGETPLNDHHPDLFNNAEAVLKSANKAEEIITMTTLLLSYCTYAASLSEGRCVKLARTRKVTSQESQLSLEELSLSLFVCAADNLHM